mgnify:CR=1 FL=1
MRFSLRHVAEAAVLSLISAALFAGFFRLNDLIFSALEHSQGVNWIFLPAGFRVLLVLGMGLPGCVGIFLGNLYLDQKNLFAPDHAGMTLMTAVVSGFTPWVVMNAMKHVHMLDASLQKLTHQQLLNFTLFYAAANAIFHQMTWSLGNATAHQPWIEVWPMFIGDVLGAMIMLYAFKGLLNLFKQRSSRSF